MHTMERETPRIIMGILWASGQPAEWKQEKMRLSVARKRVSPTARSDADLTVYLKVVGSGPRLTRHHIKGDPALILRHQSALRRKAFVLV